MKEKITMDHPSLSHASIYPSLKRALEHVASLCPLGSANKIMDQLKTDFWTRVATSLRADETYFILASRATKEDHDLNAIYVPERMQFMASKRNWLYRYVCIGKSSLRLSLLPLTEHELPEHAFQLESAQLWMLLLAMTAKELGGGTCDFKAALAVKYLWENSQGINRIELVAALDFKHCYVLVNREGTLADYRTWGNNTWVVEPWYGEKGMIYPASELAEKLMKIKQFDLEQHLAFKTRGYDNGPYTLSASVAVGCRLICEIEPQQQPYPRFDGKPWDYYYSVDMYPRDEGELGTLFPVVKHVAKHKETMRACLTDIKNKTHPLLSSRYSLFAHGHNPEHNEGSTGLYRESYSGALSLCSG